MHLVSLSGVIMFSVLFLGCRAVWSESGCDELHKWRKRDTQSSRTSVTIHRVGFLSGTFHNCFQP